MTDCSAGNQRAVLTRQLTIIIFKKEKETSGQG